ncbi:uncharacterized protein LOC143895019 [Temnothorax americanus]|uniref:uncharacterized protein LOC143895019 n=1 Tax=Temnothorax americanus TaxID=1964332 RepID=UPI0040676DF2
MGSLIIVLTAFAVYCSEVYCDTHPTKVAEPEDTVLLEKNNNSNATIEKGSLWKSLSPSRRKPTKLEESRNLVSSTNSEANKRRGRFLSSLAFLTGLGFGGLATAASSTVKSKTIAKMPQVFSINLGASKTSPYFAAYYGQYPQAPFLPYPFFYPGPSGFAPTIGAVKTQTSQNDLTPQVINLFDNRPNDLVGNNEDYAEDTENAGNGADDRIRLQAEADRNAEEKGMIGECKEGQRKHGKGTAREREYLQVNAADLRATLNFQAANQTVPDNATTTSSPNDTNTTHHHHHHYGGYKEYPHFPGYYVKN